MVSPYNIHNIIIILLRTGTSGAEQSSSSIIRRRGIEPLRRVAVAVRNQQLWFGASALSEKGESRRGCGASCIREARRTSLPAPPVRKLRKTWGNESFSALFCGFTKQLDV